MVGGGFAGRGGGEIPLGGFGEGVYVVPGRGLGKDLGMVK